MTDRDRVGAEARRRIAMAILDAIQRERSGVRPLQFLGPVMFSLGENVREVWGGQGQDPPLLAAVDSKWRLYYDPEWIVGQTPQMIEMVMAHEALHCVLMHHMRAVSIGVTPETHELANIAEDCAIAEILMESGVALPDFHCTTDKFSLEPGLPWETWYWQLVDRAKKGGAKKGGKPGVGGSCADGVPRAYEDSDSDKTAMSPERQEEVARSAMERQAESRKAGSDPGRLGIEIDRALTPKVNPRDAFMRRVGKSMRPRRGMDDWTYRRPSRRSAGGTIIRPSMVGHDPRMTVIIDTSGSMMGDDIMLAVGLTRKCVKAAGEVRVVAGDTRTTLDKVCNNPAMVAGLTGGGGTDMDAVIKEVCADDRQDVVVCITDGYTGWPSKEDVRGQTVFVALTRPDMADHVPKYLNPMVVR